MPLYVINILNSNIISIHSQLIASLFPTMTIFLTKYESKGEECDRQKNRETIALGSPRLMCGQSCEDVWLRRCAVTSTQFGLEW